MHEAMLRVGGYRSGEVCYAILRRGLASDVLMLMVTGFRVRTFFPKQGAAGFLADHAGRVVRVAVGCGVGC